MADVIQLDDLVYTYPDQANPQFQTLITAKREFNQLASTPYEPIPERGQYFRHQQLIKRFMLAYDRVLLFHGTGTGKTCSAVAAAEQFRRDLIGVVGDFVNEYLAPKRTQIRHVYILTRGQTLINEFQRQLVCKCTAGDYEPTIARPMAMSAIRANVTKRVGQYYTITTYEKLAKSIYRENLTDDQIRARYSGSLFIIDEVQLVNTEPDVVGEPDPTDATDATAPSPDRTLHPERKKALIYETLHRIFHVIDRSKVMLLTATPMINRTAEVATIMNLLLPLDRQMPLNVDYSTWTVEQLKPYFNGLISYVRAAETGAVPIYFGTNLGASYTIGDQVIESQETVYRDTMSDYQTRGYLQLVEPGDRSDEDAPEVSDEELETLEESPEETRLVEPGELPPSTSELAVAIRSQERFNLQKRYAANFVFPNYLVGRAGFQRYVQTDRSGSYRATREFRELLQDPNQLARMSTKYASIVSLCKNEPGSCFCFSNFVVGSGAVVLGLAFEAQGFENFLGTRSAFQTMEGGLATSYCGSDASREVATRRAIGSPSYMAGPRLDRRPRFAMLTRGMTEAQVSNVLELFNSYENRHGEYLKVVIGTPKAGVGISLSNVVQIHLVEPSFNRSNTYQAISRAIRATSHNMLVEEQRRQLEDRGQDPNEAQVAIRIYQHAAVLPPTVRVENDAIDLQLYRLSERKDIKIKHVERAMKRTAFDCWIHRARNIGPADAQDGDTACDYGSCQYSCVDPYPDFIDNSSYDVLYVDPLIDELIERLRELFHKGFIVRLDRLIEVANYPRRYLELALRRLVDEKTTFIDRYGYPSYVRVEGETIYLQRTYPTNRPDQNHGASYYSSRLFALNRISLNQYLNQLQGRTAERKIDRLRSERPGSAAFHRILDEMPLDYVIELFEEALIDYVYERSTNPDFTNAIIDYYRAYLFFYPEPQGALAAAQAQIERMGRGRGRKPKPGAEFEIRRLEPEQLQQIIAIPGTGDYVYVHAMSKLRPDKTDYERMSQLTKVDVPLRILKPEEGVGWRDPSANEYQVYNALIQNTIQERLQPFEALSIYGIIVRPKRKFHIRDKTTEQVKTAGRRDRRDVNRGRVCNTLSKPALVELMRKLGIPAPRDPAADLSLEAIHNRLNQQGVSRDKLIDEATARYYYNWYAAVNEQGRSYTKDQLCGTIRDWMDANNMIYYE